jgi:hypothetical protein
MRVCLYCVSLARDYGGAGKLAATAVHGPALGYGVNGVFSRVAVKTYQAAGHPDTAFTDARHTHVLQITKCITYLPSSEN